MLTLKDAPPAAPGNLTLIAPGVKALGLVNMPNTESWFSTQPFDKDMEFENSADIVLYFVASAQAITVFEVRLLDVYPNGEVQLLTQDSEQFITALDSRPVSFFMNTEGLTIREGHFLQIQVFAQTGNAAVLMQYGGGTPSGVAGLKMRWLDSDGDGVTDSDEKIEGTNPLDPDQELNFDFRDTDGDGLSDSLERNITTDPSRADTDGDGWGDGIEFNADSNPKDRNSVPYDQDRDGLPDSFETNYFGNNTNVNATFTGVDPLGDPDGDGCNNLREAALGTDPTKKDTDGDSINDCDEVNTGGNPLSPSAASTLGPDRRELQLGAGLFALSSIMSLFGLFWWKP